MGLGSLRTGIAAALTLSVTLVACSDMPAPVERHQALTTERRASQSVALGGILVTVETTPGPAPEPPGGGVALNEPESPARDKVRFTLRATALNSTEETISVRLSHHFPVVRDLGGTYLEPVSGWLTAGPSDSKFSPQGETLGPGGVLETMQAFDVDPEERDLRFEWDFYERGVATVTLQPPAP